MISCVPLFKRGGKFWKTANAKWTVMKIEIKMMDGKSIIELDTPDRSPWEIYERYSKLFQNTYMYLKYKRDVILWLRELR